jgi:endo-1,4-beta-xylanase
VLLLMALTAILSACATPAEPGPDNGPESAQFTAIPATSTPLPDPPDTIGVRIDEADLSDPVAIAFAEEFANNILIDGYLYWGRTEAEFNNPKAAEEKFTIARRIVDFAVERDMTIQGHHLVWGLNLPDWLKQKKLTRPEIEDYVRQRIDELMRTFPEIGVWSVVNEPLNEPDRNFWIRQWEADGGTREEFIAFAFREARSAADTYRPGQETVLLLNDYQNENRYSEVRETRARGEEFLALAIDLRSRGVPVDAVGLQFHRPLSSGIDEEGVLKTLRDYKDAGFRVFITEFDTPRRDFKGSLAAADVRQVEVVGAYMRAIVASAAVENITFFGITDEHPGYQRPERGEEPEPKNLLRNGKPKPVVEAINEELGR